MFHMTPEELVKLKQIHASIGTGDDTDAMPTELEAPQLDEQSQARSVAPIRVYSAASDPYNKRAEDYNTRASQLEDQSVQSRPQPQGTKQVLLSAARAAMENFGKYGAPGGYYGQEQEREKQFQTKNAQLAARAKELRGEAGKEQQLGMAAEAGARQENYQQGELTNKNEQLDLTKSANTERARHNTATEDITSRIPHPIAEGAAVSDGKGGYTVPSPKTPPTKQLESKTVMVKGKPEVWSVDMSNPQGAKLVNKIGDAPPQSGANSALAVEQGTDEAGKPAFFIVNKSSATSTPVKTDKGQTLESKPTAQAQNRADQADVISSYADHISSLIDANPNAVGPIMGRIARGETIVGNVDPGAKALGTALGSFTALQPILHGFRGGSQTVDHFNAVLGDQHLNAAALKASVAEIKFLAKQIKAGMLPGMTEAGSEAPTTDGSKHVNWSDLK